MDSRLLHKESKSSTKKAILFEDGFGRSEERSNGWNKDLVIWSGLFRSTLFYKINPEMQSVRNKTLLVFFAHFVFLLACQNKKSGPGRGPVSSRSRPLNQNIKKEIDIDSNLLTSHKDLVCYMPLWTGIGDTCQYQGRIYGFCSTDCKRDFLKNPEAYLPH